MFTNYSRTLVARTLMACLPWLFELVLESLNPIAADIIVFGIILGDFRFYIDKIGCVYSLESPP